MTMIRINLIAEKKTSAPKPVKRESKQASDLQENIILLALVGVALLVFFSMRHFTKAELNATRNEEQRLKRDYEQNWAHWKEKKLDYEIQKELLNEKIQKISELRNRRQGPVKLMEDVINTMPESVWLESVTQGFNKELTIGKGSERKADTPSKNLSDPRMVRVTGFAKTADSITNFADRLYRLDDRYQKVDLSVLRRMEAEGTGDKQFRFEIYFEIRSPGTNQDGNQEGGGS